MEPEMTSLIPFAGKPLCSNFTMLGEGPSYDSTTDTLWWLNILEKELHELHVSTGKKTVHHLPIMASVVARVDADRQMLATELGIYIRDMKTGALSEFVAIEADKPETRCNDGRVHPSGALWFGTMGKGAEDFAGAIYHVAGTKVTKIVSDISIPNGICFSADGKQGYYVDSKVNHYMRFDVDPATGLPIGEAMLWSDTSAQPGSTDGSIMAADGTIWNARWGHGEVHHYAKDGTITERYAVPMKQVTCPAVFGTNADRLAFTSAWEHMSDEQRAKDPLNGITFDLGVTIAGRFEPAFKL